MEGWGEELDEKGKKWRYSKPLFLNRIGLKFRVPGRGFPIKERCERGVRATRGASKTEGAGPEGSKVRRPDTNGKKNIEELKKDFLWEEPTMKGAGRTQTQPREERKMINRFFPEKTIRMTSLLWGSLTDYKRPKASVRNRGKG